LRQVEIAVRGRLVLGRKALSTTIDEDLLRELKVAAARLDRPLNQLLEDGARKVLEDLWAADPDNRLFAERRDEPEEDLVDEIEARLKRIRGAGATPAV
jgi:hypothetical protein